MLRMPERNSHHPERPSAHTALTFLVIQRRDRERDRATRGSGGTVARLPLSVPGT